MRGISLHHWKRYDLILIKNWCSLRESNPIISGLQNHYSTIELREPDLFRILLIRLYVCADGFNPNLAHT